MAITSQFLGIVDVPIFDAGFSNEEILTYPGFTQMLQGLTPYFVPQSNYAQLFYTFLSTIPGQFEPGFASYVMLKGGPSIMTQDPTGAQGATTAVVSYVDGNFICIMPADNPSGGDIFFQAWLQKRQDPTPGVKPPPSNTIGVSYGGLRLASYEVGFPCNYLGNPAMCELVDVFGGTVSIYFLNEGGKYWSVQCNPNILFAGAGTPVMNRLTPRLDFNNLDDLNLYDNVIFYGAVSTGVGRLAGPLHYMVSSDSGANIENEIFIDDTGLPGGLANLFHTVGSPTANADGFCFILNTNGTGPTRQVNEVLFMTTDAQFYWILRFIPQDEASSRHVSAGTSAGSWSIKQDPNGIIWFAPTLADPPEEQTKMFYSYSPINFGLPWIYPGELQPITIPCYSTCQPVQSS